jgi:hypothetical protein
MKLLLQPAGGSEGDKTLNVHLWAPEKMDAETAIELNPKHKIKETKTI